MERLRYTVDYGPKYSAISRHAAPKQSTQSIPASIRRSLMTVGLVRDDRSFATMSYTTSWDTIDRYWLAGVPRCVAGHEMPSAEGPFIMDKRLI